MSELLSSITESNSGFNLLFLDFDFDFLFFFLVLVYFRELLSGLTSG
jgi:hypothetical protein